MSQSIFLPPIPTPDRWRKAATRLDFRLLARLTRCELPADEQGKETDSYDEDDGEHHNNTGFLRSPVALGEVRESVASDDRVLDGGHFRWRVKGAGEMRDQQEAY